MEDDFELISKSELNALKEENEKLKGKSSISNIKESSPQILQELTELLTQEAKKERLFVLKNLEEIKELNKQTLNNVLTRTEAMEFKIEDLIDSLSKLVETMSGVMPSSNQKNENKNEINEEILQSMNYIEANVKGLTNKILEIDDFMHKLKVLLGQIQPKELSMNTQQSSHISENHMSSNK